MSKQKQRLISKAKSFKRLSNEVSAAKSDEVCLFDMTIMPNEHNETYALHDRRFCPTSHDTYQTNESKIDTQRPSSEQSNLLRCNSVIEMRDRYQRRLASFT